MPVGKTRSLIVALAFAVLSAGLGYAPLGLVGAFVLLLVGLWAPEASPSVEDRPSSNTAWGEAFEALRVAVDGSEPFEAVTLAAEAARDAAPETGPELLLIDIEVARCRASDGDTSEDLRRELAGYLALVKHLWGISDSSYADVAYALALVHWTRAEACLESGGQVGFHDQERLERVGQNVLQFFRPEDMADEEDPLDDEDQPSIGARLATYAFQWHDLYQAEALFGEAATAYDASYGPGGVRAAQCRSRLAQALAVNRAPGRGIQLAGEALRDLDVAAKEDPMLLGPVYTALGLGYQLQGREAEAKIYFDRSDALVGGDGPSELASPPVVLASPPVLPEITSAAEHPDEGLRLKLDGDSSEFWVHLPEESEPTIH